MRTEDAITYFTRAGDTRTMAITRLAAACRLSRTSIYDWDECVPDQYQARLHLLTDGELDSGLRPVEAPAA